MELEVSASNGYKRYEMGKNGLISGVKIEKWDKWKRE